MATSCIWTLTVFSVAILATMFGLLKNVEEIEQAVAEVGDQYQVCRAEDGQVVAEFDTDWLAEAYLDEHYNESLVISSPEERYKTALKAIRQR